MRISLRTPTYKGEFWCVVAEHFYSALFDNLVVGTVNTLYVIQYAPVTW